MGITPSNFGTRHTECEPRASFRESSVLPGHRWVLGEASFRNGAVSPFRPAREQNVHVRPAWDASVIATLRNDAKSANYKNPKVSTPKSDAAKLLDVSLEKWPSTAEKRTVDGLIAVALEIIAQEPMANVDKFVSLLNANELKGADSIVSAAGVYVSNVRRDAARVALRNISPKSTQEEISRLVNKHDIDVSRAEKFADLYEPGRLNMREVAEFADVYGRFRNVSVELISRMVSAKRDKGKTGVSPFAAAKYALKRAQAVAEKARRPSEASISSVVNPVVYETKDEEINRSAKEAYRLYITTAPTDERMTFGAFRKQYLLTFQGISKFSDP